MEPAARCHNGVGVSVVATARLAGIYAECEGVSIGGLPRASIVLQV